MLEAVREQGSGGGTRITTTTNANTAVVAGY